jgi:hypothetical protein
LPATELLRGLPKDNDVVRRHLVIIVIVGIKYAEGQAKQLLVEKVRRSSILEANRESFLEESDDLDETTIMFRELMGG